MEEQTYIPTGPVQGGLRWDCLALQALALQASIASPPTGARGNLARRDGAEGHDNSAGAKEAMSVQYARVDGVLRGGAPPPVRRDARGQREQQRRAKPVVRTASDRRQPVLRPLEFTKLWSSRRMYRASKCLAITKTLKIATINMQDSGNETLDGFSHRLLTIVLKTSGTQYAFHAVHAPTGNREHHRKIFFTDLEVYTNKLAEPVQKRVCR